MPTHITIVNPADWMPQIGALLAENWAETGFDFKFRPDVDAYRRMFEAGVVFAVRAELDGETVGYCTVAVTPHPWNPEVVMASNDALFVRPDLRGGTLAARLIRAAEGEARARGASRFTWHCRAGTTLAGVLTHHGYEPVDNVVMRRL